MRITRVMMVFTLTASSALLAQPASVVRDSELKGEPFADAKTVTTLKAKQKVDIGERQGGWYKAKSGTKTGWVRLTSVLLDASQGKGDSGVSAARQMIATGRSGSSGVTAATGVRGLDSADVVNATPDLQAVAGLEKNAASADESKSFAAAEKLAAKRIDY